MRQDRTSGAAELVPKAAETLEWAARQVGFSDAALVAVGQELIRAQPAMASIFNLVNAALLAGVERAAESCREFLTRTERAAQAVAAEAARHIQDNVTVMTHSWSSTVLRALLTAWETGRRFQVICTESRPLREGVTLARKLAGASVPVRLIVDAAAYSFLEQTQLALVGADSITARGLVNKAGTAALALTAKTLGVPVYTLASTDKFLPARYAAPAQELRDPGEILEERVENVIPVNYYFDVTPLQYLTGVVTEEGVLRPDTVAARLEALPVHPGLAG